MSDEQWLGLVRRCYELGIIDRAEYEHWATLAAVELADDART